MSKILGFWPRVKGGIILILDTKDGNLEPKVTINLAECLADKTCVLQSVTSTRFSITQSANSLSGYGNNKIQSQDGLTIGERSLAQRVAKYMNLTFMKIIKISLQSSQGV